MLPEMIFQNIEDYIDFLEAMEVINGTAKKAKVSDEELTSFASLLLEIEEDKGD